MQNILTYIFLLLRHMSKLFIEHDKKQRLNILFNDLVYRKTFPFWFSSYTLQ